MSKILSFLFFAFILQVAASVNSDVDCDASDAALKKARGYVCSSLLGNTPGGNDWCPSDVTDADCDWPTQAEYMQDFINLLSSPSTCFNTPYMNDTINWLNGPLADPNTSSSYMWTYLVFQVQYYDMPRKEGTRIESPGTLGRKCWAMAFEKQVWNPDSWTPAVTANDLPLPKQFITNYEQAIPLTMDLCDKVQQNCFQNTTYDPSKDGTCKWAIDEFHFGFDRENLKRHNMVTYPFE